MRELGNLAAAKNLAISSQTWSRAVWARRKFAQPRGGLPQPGNTSREAFFGADSVPC